MAIIPNDEQFIGLSASVNTTERRSALINAESQAYTMQDIVDTVGSALPPAVNPTDQYAPINFGGELADSPFSAAVGMVGYTGWPVLQTQVGQLISLPPGVDQSNVAPYLPYYGLSIQNNPIIGVKTTLGAYQGGFMNFSVNGANNGSLSNSLYVSPVTPGQFSPFWVKGDGTRVQIGQQINFNSSNILNGIIVDSSLGILKLNANSANPDFGMMSIDNNTGLAVIGYEAATSVGLNTFYGSFHVGSFVMDPYFSPTAGIANWIKVVDQNGVQYKIPLYQ